MKEKNKINLVTGLFSVIIVIFCFSKIRTEFASGLSDLMGNILSVFVALVIYGIYLIISHCISKPNIQKIIACICLVLIFLSSFFINHYERGQWTNEEIRERQLKELRTLTRKTNKILAKNENIITNYTILKEDSAAIVNYFNHFLDSAFYRNSDSLMLRYSATFSHFFNRNLTHRIYAELLMDTASVNKYRQIMKDNLSIDFFSYSPDKSKLFIIITYEIGEEPTGANALAMIGERKDNKLILYRHICGFRNDFQL